MNNNQNLQTQSPSKPVWLTPRLWPELAATPSIRPAAAQPSDLFAVYSAASDPAAPDWEALIRDAADQIELLGDTLTPAPGELELLATKASNGCDVRILVYEVERDLVPLLGHPRIEVRVLNVPAHYTTHRFDEQLILTLELLGEEAETAPLVHLRRAAPSGLSTASAGTPNDLWEHDSQPINPARDLSFDGNHGEDETPSPVPACLPRTRSQHVARSRQPQRPDAGPGDRERSLGLGI